MVYSEHLAKTIAILPKISGSLSLIGSFFIARNVYRKWRGQRSNEHLPATIRAVANMTIADMGSSFWAHFMGTWMMPSEYADTQNEDLHYKPFAAGNQATCTAQAFLQTFFVFTGGWCNAFLALTYYLTVCRQVTESELMNWKYKLLLLVWPWIFGLFMALVNIIIDGGGSVLTDTWFCEAWAGSWAFSFTVALIGLGLLIILFSMGSLIRVVYLTEKRMDRFCQEGDGNNREKTLQVSMQGLSYIAAYLVIFIPVIVTMFDMPNGYYVFFACIFPTQGFLNSIVYFRPKYVSVRNRQGNTRPSRLRATLEVLDIHLSLPRPFASATSHVKSTGHSNDLNGD